MMLCANYESSEPSGFREEDFQDFRASNGWLENWKVKYSIKFYKVCGESGDVEEKQVETFRKQVSKVVEGYSHENIFNCDETGLFFRAVSDKSLSVKGDKCKGGKLSKERLTVMLACSATGEKLKPLVIGKAYRPRCFKNIKVENLPCTWRANKKAWMTENTFIDWVAELNKNMKKKKRKIILFLDNATSHAKELHLTNVQLQYLPPNTTSRVQPLDLGIIRAFKARYRKLLSRHIVANIEKCETVTELTKSLNVLDAIHWINTSWQSTKQSTIVKCFRDAGIISDGTSEENGCEGINDDDDDDDDDVPLAELLCRRTTDLPNIDDMFEFEDEIPTDETYSGDWESTIIKDMCNKQNIDQDSSDSDDSGADSSEQSSLTYTMVQEMLKDIKRFALQHDGRFLGPVQGLLDLADQCYLEKHSLKKQKTIDSFFTKK